MLFYLSAIGQRVSLCTFFALLLLSSLATETFGQKLELESKPDVIDLKPSVPPIKMSGNPNCATLNSDNSQFPRITTNFELKNDSGNHGGPWPFQTSGTRFLVGPTDLGNTITTSGNSTLVSFNSTKLISAVIVKGGPAANVYYYENGTFGETNLGVPSGSISHVTFCYFQPAKVTIIKRVTTLDPPPNNTSSTVVFGFTATNLATNSFSLIDQNVIGPDRYSQSNVYKFSPNSVINVTENLGPIGSGWTLADISCKETSGGGVASVSDSTVNLATRTAKIKLQQGEDVECIFSNTQLVPTAARASISGRIVDQQGQGIGSVSVTVTDLQTGAQWGTISSPFGFYLIEGPEVGSFYMLTVSHKRFSFADNPRSFSLSQDLTDVDFVAEP
jgi:hypothetical protein